MSTDKDKKHERDHGSFKAKIAPRGKGFSLFISFEEAVKFNMALQSAIILGSNRSKRNTKKGKNHNIVIYTLDDVPKRGSPNPRKATFSVWDEAKDDAPKKPTITTGILL